MTREAGRPLPIDRDSASVTVGPSANYAAKLCSIRGDFPSFVTEGVYNNATEEAKVAKDGRQMWEKRSWNGRSSWWWGF